MKKSFYIFAALALGLSACTADKGELAVIPTPVPNSPPVKIVITVTDFSFTPQNATATVGDTIRWINNGPSPHTVDASSLPSGATAFPVSPNNVNAADSFQYIVNVVGTYNIGCAYHPPGMVGTINVSQ